MSPTSADAGVHGKMMRIAVIMAYYEPVTRYVRQALESVREQTAYAQVSELILVNDGGTPNMSPTDTWPVPGFEGIVRKLVRHPENRGQAAALNMALRMLEPGTNAIAFIDADDLWVPRKLEVLAQALESSPGVVATYGRQVIVGADYWRGEAWPGEALDAGRILGTVLVSRRWCPEFHEGVGVGHTLLWFAALDATGGEVMPVREPVLLRRIHGGNYGVVHRERARMEYLQALKLMTEGTFQCKKT